MYTCSVINAATTAIMHVIVVYVFHLLTTFRHLRQVPFPLRLRLTRLASNLRLQKTCEGAAPERKSE